KATAGFGFVFARELVGLRGERIRDPAPEVGQTCGNGNAVGEGKRRHRKPLRVEAEASKQAPDAKSRKPGAEGALARASYDMKREACRNNVLDPALQQHEQSLVATALQGLR